MQKDSSVKNVEVITFPVVSDKQDATDYAGGAGASFFVNKNTDTPKESADFAMYISEKMGNRLWNLVTGFPCWNTEIDTDKVSPTLIN